MMNPDDTFVAELRKSSLTVLELARGLRVSKPTITRWLLGKNLPMPAMRKAVLKFLGSSVSGRPSDSRSGNESSILSDPTRRQ